MDTYCYSDPLAGKNAAHALRPTKYTNTIAPPLFLLEELQKTNASHHCHRYSGDSTAVQ
jgi:hypothetical protein